MFIFYYMVRVGAFFRLTGLNFEWIQKVHAKYADKIAKSAMIDRMMFNACGYCTKNMRGFAF